MITNVPALAFWTRAECRYTQQILKPMTVTKGDETRYLFRFESVSDSPN
jgi:hypothetical protein